MRTLPALVILGLGLALPAASDPGELREVPIREWPVPWEESRPRDPFAASGSSVWFVGQKGNYLARFDVESEAFTKVDLPDEPGPHNLIVGDDGSVWYAGNLKGYIGRYDPESEMIERIAMSDPKARDPHTLVFDGAGHIFFTVQGGNFVGRLRMADRKVDLVAVPTPGARPYGIDVAPDGIVWVALFGTNTLASLDPQTLDLRMHALPREDARPRRLAVAADGRVWYVDFAGGRLGAYMPGEDAFEEWELPSGEDASPYGMAIDGHGRIWMVETRPQPNRFVGFDPEAERFFAGASIPSGGGAVRHMHHHAPTGSVWFGTDANTLGRAAVAEGTTGAP